ncbi:MAG: M1 family aminopeptidase [Pedobacter sp.]|uniref:M1 family aminopeptidase n=1 Tax=Pedobacter sp. TaxID=1411316 RepID=UPI0033943670
MDYHLSWDGQSSILKMDIFYNDHGNDSTVFVFGNPQAGGQPRIFDILGNLKSENGEAIEIIKSQRKIVVQHRNSGVKTLHAEIDGKLVPDQQRAKVNEAFRTTVAPGFFYTMGYQLFMYLRDTSYNQIGIKWDHWPKGMPYLISTNPEAKPDELQVISYEGSARNEIMIHMSSNMMITKRKLDGIQHYLVTSKSDTSSGVPDKLKDFMVTFMPSMRAFWNDRKAPFFILSAIPLLSEVPTTMTGMALPNGMSVRYRGPLEKDKLRIVAHEVSHNWIGVNLKIAQNGMENNWFNEGFNDYIAIYNLVKTGLYSKADFVNYMNYENLTPHYSSSVGEVPGDSIETNFFKSVLYERLPYHRGFIYAFYLDNQLRLASGGKKTIREFLQALNANRNSDGATVLTKADFVRVIRPFLPGKDISAEINRYLAGGQYLDFRKIKLIQGFSIQYEQQVPLLTLSDQVNLQQVFR